MAETTVSGNPATVPSGSVVGVFGHYGNRNLGDEAIVAATIQQLRLRLDAVEIVCFSLRPNDTALRHGVECFSVCRSSRFPTALKPEGATEVGELPWARAEQFDAVERATDASVSLKGFLKRLPVVAPIARLLVRTARATASLFQEARFVYRSAAYLRRFDLLVVAGSNQFLDNFGGPLGFPYDLLKWSLLARITRTPLAFVSVGAGPLESRLSRFMVRCALRLADYVSYRDKASKDLVESGWPAIDGFVFPDLAFGLEYSEHERTRDAEAKPVVGINPMPVYDRRYWFEHDERRYRAYVDKVAAFAARLIADAYPVFFFPTMWRDDNVIRDVLQALRQAYGVEVDEDRYYRPNQRVDELIELLQEADIVVATRFHGVVLPYRLELPVLGIGYYRKTLDLMREMGQAEYHENLDDCDVDRLWQKFRKLEANLVEERRRIGHKSQEYRLLVSRQWDAVAGLAK